MRIKNWIPIFTKALFYVGVPYLFMVSLSFIFAVVNDENVYLINRIGNILIVIGIICLTLIFYFVHKQKTKEKIKCY